MLPLLPRALYLLSMSPWLALELFLDFALPALLFALGLYLIRSSIPKSKIKTTPICRACRYNLTGITAPTCPECGFPLSPTRRQLWDLIPKKRATLGLLFTLPFLWVLWMFVSFYAWVIPLQYHLNQVIQTRPSGAAAKVNWQYPHFEDTRSDTWRDQAGLWLTSQIIILFTPPRPVSPNQVQFEAVRLTRRHNVTLDPSLTSINLPVRTSTFIIQYIFWPTDHYRRYVQILDEPPSAVTITNASPRDQDLFSRLAKIGPFTELHVITSHIDADSLQSIADLPSLTFLDIQSVTAPMPELRQLQKLPNLENLSIDFGRPISPHDIQTLDTLPKLATLTLTAHQVQPGCDPALAKLASKPSLWRLRLNVNLTENDFPLTLAVLRQRFADLPKIGKP
jgi:ribosomal protein L37E